MRAALAPLLMFTACATTPAPTISFEEATSQGPRVTTAGARLSDAVDRFAEGSKIRREGVKPGAPMPDGQAQGWSSVLELGDAFLKRPGSAAWLNDALRTRVKLQAEFQADAERYGDVPGPLAEHVSGFLRQLSVRIARLNPSEQPFTPARLRWPLDGVIVSSPYGTRVHPVRGGTQFHAGIDLEAPVAEPVYAAANGVVTFAEWNGGHGQQVELRHDAHWSTRYSHLDTMLVKSGTRVKQGQPIGLVGETGLTTGPHLHFELRKDGDALDPEVFLKPPAASPLVSAGAR